MPLGALILLTVFARVVVAGVEAEIRHRLPNLRVAKLRIASEVSDQDDFVDGRLGRGISVEEG
jgi:hypothetical protein